MDNTRHVSIAQNHKKQAQEIAIKRPQTFKNWQDVIRLAVHYGLPEIGRVQERERLHQAAINMSQMTQQGVKETKALRGVPTRDRVCPPEENKVLVNCKKICPTCPKWIKWQQDK